MSTMKSNVLAILRDVPEARNSDLILTREYWKRFDKVDVTMAVLRTLTPQNSLVRLRCALQEEGNYPADELVKRERRKLERECRNSIIHRRDLPSSLAELGGRNDGFIHNKNIQSLVSKLNGVQ